MSSHQIDIFRMVHQCAALVFGLLAETQTWCVA
jgi:hypothetical protein